MFRIISENSGFEVVEKVSPDGTVYYEPKLDANKKPIPAKSLTNGTKLSLRDINVLRDAGYTDGEIEQVKDGSLEWELDDLAPAAGDAFLSYITEPMLDIKGQPLYHWGVDVHGIRQDDHRVAVDTLEVTAAGVEIVRHSYPDKELASVVGKFGEQQRVVTFLRKVAQEDADQEVKQAAQEALRVFLPHAVSRDLQRQAAYGIAGLAGLEETAAAPAPIIGLLRYIGKRPDNQLARLLRQGARSVRVEQDYRAAHENKPQGPLFDVFDQRFGQLLRLTHGNMQAFGDLIIRTQHFYVDRQMNGDEAALMAGVHRLAQDPGAPHNKPPLSYFNPARYAYTRLRRQAFDGFVQQVLDPAVEAVRSAVSSEDLSKMSIEQKAALVQRLQKLLDPKGEGRITAGPYQYEIFYDSLVEKDGERYLTLELLLDGEKDYHQGVVLELQVVIPAAGKPQIYRSPYTLSALTADYSVGLLDPIQFINTRFPEWRPSAERDIYESRLYTLKQTKGKVTRQYLRISDRQGNNPRTFEPHIEAFLVGNVPFVYHIVDALGSERDYGNQGGVGSIGNLASAIVRRGGLGVTVAMYEADPETAKALSREGRKLLYAYEKDHHRIDNINDVKGFSSELEPFLAAYWEGAVTGWPSGNLQDETKFIVQRVRDPWMVLNVLAQTPIGPISERLRKELTDYVGGIYGSEPAEEQAKKALLDAVNGTGQINQATFDQLMQRVQIRLEPIFGQRTAEGWLSLVEGTIRNGVINPDTFRGLQAMYAAPIGQDLPSAFELHWLRNRFFHHVVDAAREQGINVTPFENWYIEPDYALDGKPHTIEEMAYLTMMSWVSALAQGHKLGAVVPSYGNTHGADAGDPNLILAGIHQYAGQAATIYGQPVTNFQDILAIARKAPNGSVARVRQYIANFGDQALGQEFLQTVESAGERTEREEEQLRDFVLRQLQQIPQHVLKALKQAERERRSLAEVAPQVAQELDTAINALPLDRRAAITTHAASGLSADQLREARLAGIWAANKSTEFQNIITKMLHVVYLMAADPAQAQLELDHLPAAKAYLLQYPLTQAEIQHVAQLYDRMYQATVARAVKAEKKDEKKSALQQAGQDPLRRFPWYWRDNLGWSMTDHAGVSWKKTHEFLPGPHGRYMFSMRDKMTGQGIDDTLLFPNELTWGLPDKVLMMAHHEIVRTIRFYHQTQYMNAEGGAAEFPVYMAAKVGLEEPVQQAIKGLDAPTEEARLEAVRALREFERRRVRVPTVGPVLPSYAHVHTTGSYWKLPGTFSPTHMIWAAHEAGAGVIFLVDHETVAHIHEGFEAAQIVNEGSSNPVRPVFGVEFRAPVNPSRADLLDALRRGVGRGEAAWVVGMGVPVDAEGNPPRALGALVAQFQAAKERRGAEQVVSLTTGGIGLKVGLSTESLLPLVTNRNVTERQLSFDIARAVLGAQAGQDALLTMCAAEIRTEITKVPYRLEAGFPPYEQVVRRLAEIGMIPSFTMQVSAGDLERLLPELKGIGIRALDLSGIESHHANAVADINSVINLARRNRLPVVGGVDYRGEGAIGWPEAAHWMNNPAIGIGLLAAQASASVGTDPVLRPLVERSIAALAGPEDPVVLNAPKTQFTVYPDLIEPLTFLRWLAEGRSHSPQLLRGQAIDGLIQQILKKERIGRVRVVTELRFGGRENLANDIRREVPVFAPAAVTDEAPRGYDPEIPGAGLEEPQEVTEARAAVENAKMLAASADREGDQSLGTIAQTQQIDAENHLGRVTAVPTGPRIPPDSGPILVDAGLEGPATFAWAAPWLKQLGSLGVTAYDGLVRIPNQRAVTPEGRPDEGAGKVRLARADLLPLLDSSSRVLEVPKVPETDAQIRSAITVWVQPGITLPPDLREGVVVRTLPLELTDEALAELKQAHPEELVFLNADRVESEIQGRWTSALSERGLFGLWVSPRSATFRGLTRSDLATIRIILRATGGSLYVLDLRSDKNSLLVYLRNA